uniref:non-specific serine/threonine protein kinase n=1 Tax=Leersia perrieri TaxID=77586 RepID=A0A0D9W2T9_9ORYZ
MWTTANNITDGGATAMLPDSGNLVVRLRNGSKVWRSFDHPTDTVVPNVSLSLSATADHCFVACRGPDDPSSGEFSMGGDTGSDLQIVVWNGTRPHWRRAAWISAPIAGVLQSNTSFKLYQTIDDSNSFKLTMPDGSPPMRMTLDYTGVVSFRSWDGNASSWTVFAQFPTPACDTYASCGPFGYCDGADVAAAPAWIPTCLEKEVLEDGIEVAVKELSKNSGQGVEEFRNEVVLIAKLQHRNLVRLFGCCIHEAEKLLIYEYLPNKSLDAFLFDDTRKNVLDWSTCLKIIKGVARGLLYLHQDSRLRIIHRDLKASNILSDTEINPKISYFGMARIFGGKDQQANTTRVMGTYGYMSSEYALDGYFSVKSDTYSFVVRFLKFYDVVQDQPNARPIMSSILFMLENETAMLPAPKEPIYFTRRNYGTDEDSRDDTRISINSTSVTAIEGH